MRFLAVGGSTRFLVAFVTASGSSLADAETGPTEEGTG
jgi:hypothetical protein